MELATYEPTRSEAADEEYIDHSHFGIRRSCEDARSWDRFAEGCGATFRATYGAAFAWQLKHHLLFSIRRYDIILRSAMGNWKIGQFVVGMGWRARVFGDVLQVLPLYQNQWPAIMRSVLGELGSGIYYYGSDWTTEPSRTRAFSEMIGVKILKEKVIDVYAVDFSEYSSWDIFYISLSNNVRRNAAAAARFGCEVTTHHHNDRLLLNNFQLLVMKKKMFKRKELQMSFSRSLALLALRLHSLRRYLFTAKTTENTRTMSVFCGLRFGRDLYYLEGASVERPGGAAWYLLVAMLRLAYEESRGLGKCILGPDDGSARNQTAWENLRRQRLQCRAKPFATSIVAFSFVSRADDLERR